MVKINLTSLVLLITPKVLPKIEEENSKKEQILKKSSQNKLESRLPENSSRASWSYLISTCTSPYKFFSFYELCSKPTKNTYKQI